MDANLDSLHRQFVQERRYFKNLRPRSLEWHEASWRVFKKAMTNSLDAGTLSRGHLERFVITLRERGVTAAGVNSRLRSLCAFFKWAHEQGHIPQRVHLPQLREDHRLVRILDQEAIGKLLAFKPRTFGEWRVHTLALCLLDSGCRVSELLGARVGDVDWDNLLWVVQGKGGRERKVPFSLDARRLLFAFQRERTGQAPGCSRRARAGTWGFTMPIGTSG
jgi:integrase/recombinase XerD